MNDEPSILSTKEAHTLLATVRYAAISPLLKDPEFAMVTAIAFAGFRVDKNGYANPLVRKRLADEATRNDKFAERLRDIAAEAPVAVSPPAQSKPIASVAMPEHKADERHRERERIKKELDDEAKRRQTAEAMLAAVKMEALYATVAKTDALRELEQLQHKLDRIERKLRRAEMTNAQLRRLVATESVRERADITAKPQLPDTQGSPRPESEREFIEAVRRLIEKPENAVGRQIAAEVLRHSPDNEDALDVQAAAASIARDTRSAASSRHKLLGIQLRRGEFEEAARTLTLLFEIVNDAKSAREYFASLAHSTADLAPIRAVFERLRAQSPTRHQAIRVHAQGRVFDGLFAEKERGISSADEPLPLRLPAEIGRTPTGRAIVSWLDGHEASVLDALASAFTQLPEVDRERVLQAVNAASDGDMSYARLLARGAQAGPALVDASNVAWHAQEMLAAPKPRLSQVFAVCRALRHRGHFPIYIIGDANLPHVVDDAATARQWVADGRITLATSGTDADETLIREAKRLAAVVVTNDYMVEWDPEQQVPKLQYSIAPSSGEASLYEV